MRGLIVLLMIIGMIVSLSSVHAAAEQTVGVHLISQDPDPATAGDTVEIRIGIENVGDVSDGNYVVEILPSYPFEAVQGEELVKNIGQISSSIQGDNSMVVKFKVRINRDATAGTYGIPVLIYHEGQRDASLRNMFNIDIESQESAEVIYIDQVELIPGKITPIQFTINNVGSTPLRDLTFQWENADDKILPVGSDNTKYIKYIDVGDSANLTFNVVASASADPDLYKLDLKLSYNDPVTSTQRTIATKAGVYVGGATDFDVAYSGNSNGEYSFSIANIGSVAASSVTVRVPDQQGWRASGSSSVIIGNLNEGDYTVASFTLQSVSQRASSQQGTGNSPQNGNFSRFQQPQTLKLDIIYTDSRGNRNILEKEVPVAQQGNLTAADFSGSGFQGGRFRQQRSPLLMIWQTGRWVLLGALVIVVLAGAGRRYKKGKMKDPDYTYGQMIKDTFSGKKSKK